MGILATHQLNLVCCFIVHASKSANYKKVLFLNLTILTVLIACISLNCAVFKFDEVTNLGTH